MAGIQRVLPCWRRSVPYVFGVRPRCREPDGSLQLARHHSLRTARGLRRFARRLAPTANVRLIRHENDDNYTERTELVFPPASARSRLLTEGGRNIAESGMSKTAAPIEFKTNLCRPAEGG